MHIEYFHSSRFGSGERVAEEFRSRMAERGVAVDVHHVKDMKRTDPADADLYVFSSPGRFGRPIGDVRKFLSRTSLPQGARYALLTTEAAPGASKAAPPEDAAQRVASIMTEILDRKGLVKVAEERVLVTGTKGPLEDGWQEKVAKFAASLPME